MSPHPEFPHFKPIELDDRDYLRESLWRYQSQASEYSFTNLFIWRAHHGFHWSQYQDWLLIASHPQNGGPYALQPIGPAPRQNVVVTLLRWLRDEQGQQEPRIERADERLVSGIKGAKELIVEPTRDQFDYVYRREDLVKLKGRKYHSKRNHLNRFLRSHLINYTPVSGERLQECIEVAEKWCKMRRCAEDMNLLGEWEAVKEVLLNFDHLQIQGGAILVEGKVEAFALGERLNDNTAVVHIEKANPNIPQLFTVINQQFCEHNWQNVEYLNREQDLGEAGRRKAKLSYTLTIL